MATFSNRRMRCRWTTRPATANESLRIDAAHQTLIERLARAELDRQRRSQQATSLLPQGEDEHGTEEAEE